MLRVLFCIFFINTFSTSSVTHAQISPNSLDGCMEELSLECLNTLEAIYFDPNSKADYASGVANYGCFELNNAVSCRIAGQLVMKLDDHAEAPGNARNMFRRACEMGDRIGCGQLGLFQVTGTGGEIDAASARVNLTTGCETASTIQEAFCSRLDSMSGKSDESIQLEATRERIADVEANCESGIVASCGYAGLIYQVGDDVPKDDAKAAYYLTKACDGSDAFSCYALALEEMPESGMPDDPVWVYGLAQKSCKLGTYHGCELVDYLLEHDPSLSSSQAPSDIESQMSASRQRALRAAGGIPLPRPMITDENGVVMDESRAASQCEEGLSHACTYLGNAYRNGSFGAQDFEKARTFHERGCELENGRSCYAIGMMLKYGDGGTPSKALAQSYFSMACDLGDRGGCNSLD